MRPVRHRSRRPAPWLVCGVQLLGLGVAALGYVIAAFTAPAVGMWGVHPSLATRLLGAVACFAAGLGAVAGPLLVGLARRDRRWIGGSTGVAAVVGLALLALLVAGGHAGLAVTPVGQAVSTQ